MEPDQAEFTLEYVYSPSIDGEERLARAYDLILDLMLSSIQIPEEDAVGAFPNADDAGAQLGCSQVEAVPEPCRGASG